MYILVSILLAICPCLFVRVNISVWLYLSAEYIYDRNIHQYIYTHTVMISTTICILIYPQIYIAWVLDRSYFQRPSLSMLNHLRCLKNWQKQIKLGSKYSIPKHICDIHLVLFPFGLIGIRVLDHRWKRLRFAMETEPGFLPCLQLVSSPPTKPLWKSQIRGFFRMWISHKIGVSII